MAQEIRWHYRFQNFSRAYALLSKALESEIEDLNELERHGVIRRFEFTFELAWNVLKDRLEYDGVAMDSVTPQNVIRTAAAAGLIADGQTWADMLKDRENTSHRYNLDIFEDVLPKVRERYLPALNELYQRLLAEVSDEPSTACLPRFPMSRQLPPPTLERLRKVFADYPDLAEVKVYGSYATGKATPRSDIDLATIGISDRYLLGRLILDLEDLPIPQKCDVRAYEKLNHEPLKRHIDTQGITIYLKPPSNR